MMNNVWSPGPSRRQPVLGRAVALGLVMTLETCRGASSPDQTLDEYQVKAAFVYNFAKFVQWPSEAFQSPNEPVAICILGKDPFGPLLDTTVAGHKIEARSLTVRHIASLKQVAGCHILFTGTTDDQRELPLLAEIKAPGILTIGESQFAAAHGVVINFKIEGGKVRFEINVEAAEREKLRISSRLLSLAHLIEPARKGVP